MFAVAIVESDSAIAILSARQRKNYAMSLYLILSLVVGGCRADDHGLAFTVSMPAVVFSVAIVFLCICFWICCCRMMLQRKNYDRLSAFQYSTYFPRPSNYGVTQPYSLQRYSPPSTGAPSRPQSSRRQSYPSASSPAGHGASPSPAKDTASTLAQTEPPISPSEAALRHWEAPPGYEEAIKMKPPGTTD